MTLEIISEEYIWDRSKDNFCDVKFEKDAVFTDAKFIRTIDFSGAEFCQSALFGSIRLEANIDFTGAVFKQIAHFGEAKFQEVDFLDAAFCNEARFAGAEFMGTTVFTNGVFQQIARFNQANFHNKADFGEAKFEKDAVFNKVNFHNEAYFMATKFEQKACFKYAEFKQNACFGEVNFHNEADFGEAKFEQIAFFYKVNFHNEADFMATEFKQTAIFIGTEFHGITDFDKANFKSKEERAKFQKAKFKAEAYFTNIQFAGGADFGQAEFEKEVYFNDSTFRNAQKTDPEDPTKEKVEASSFHNTQFNNDVVFFNIKGDGTINFQEIQLSKDARIIFDGLNEESPEIIFDKCPLNEKNQVIFRNCHMSKVTVKNGTFEGFKFENCTWKDETPPGFIFLKVRSADLKVQKENFQQLGEKYASLKIAAKNSGDEQLASEFHFWQLYYAGKLLYKPIPKIINCLYYHVCGYGLSITRPFFSLLLLLFLSSFIYSLILNNNLCFLLSASCQPDFEAIKLSIEASTFSFDPFKLMENSGSESDKVSDGIQVFIAILYFLQKSISLFLLFEIGQAIRNKVKK